MIFDSAEGLSCREFSLRTRFRSEKNAAVLRAQRTRSKCRRFFTVLNENTRQDSFAEGKFVN